jgi:ABC-type amino acid transport system permease subunit
LTQAEDRLFMLDLAIIQLIAGILVTLGSTLFAISIGFGLTIPSALKETLSEIVAMKLDGISGIDQELLQMSLNNYVLVLAISGVVLIIFGVIFASAKMNAIKKNAKKREMLKRDDKPKPTPETFISSVQDEISEA